MSDDDGPIHILVVDDHAISRSGVVQLCALIPGAQVLGEASTGDEALELARLHAPEVVLMDVNMPGSLDGIEATPRIKSELPGTAVIILTVHKDREVIFEAIKAGASGSAAPAPNPLPGPARIVSLSALTGA